MQGGDNELRDVLVNPQENIRNEPHENANENEDNENNLEEDSETDDNDDDANDNEDGDWRFFTYWMFSTLL